MSETKRAAVNEWYDSTLSSRLDSKTEDAIVLIMQRLHVDDLVCHVLEKGLAWTHLNIPAIADSPQEIELGLDHWQEHEWRGLIGMLMAPFRKASSSRK